MLKDNNKDTNDRNTRKRSEICTTLTKKTSKRRQWRRSRDFDVNLEHSLPHFSVFIIEFEYVIVCWEKT